MSNRRSIFLSILRRLSNKWTPVVLVAATLVGVAASSNATAQGANSMPALNATLAQLNATVMQLVATVNQLASSVSQTAATVVSLDSFVRSAAASNILATAPLHNAGGVVPNCTIQNLGPTEASVTIMAKMTFGNVIKTEQRNIPAGQSATLVGRLANGGFATETWCIFQSNVPASQLRAAMELVDAATGNFYAVTDAR